MVVEFTTTHAISAIATYAMGSNPAHGEMYTIQHYVIKCVSDLRRVDGFSLGTPVSSSNKTDRHDITKLLLKVALKHHNPDFCKYQ
jgi:hypothetical protein